MQPKAPALFSVSLTNHHDRIVPVNLGMFDVVHRQVPWVFDGRYQANEPVPYDMIFNEEEGEFESAQPLQREVEANDGVEILEFLEDLGSWMTGKR